MSEITYILGAGASFQSIPLVSNFNERLLIFSEFLTQKALLAVGDERGKFISAADSIENLYKEFSSHQSFDTYFKKQFHLGNKNAINNGKRLLHLYFMWEHSRSSYDFKSKKNAGISFKKESLFDKRYDALIAGLLKPYENVAETVCKVNFITWNYDLNLIHSIKNFFYPTISYSEFIRKIEKLPFYWSINDQITIINVNGSFYSSGYDNYSDLGNLNGDDIIIQKVSDGYHEETTTDLDADKIKFAWERSDSEAKQVVTHLKQNIGTSDRVIVIGYTFPLYNRFIDMQYLNEGFFDDVARRTKKLTVQNPKANEILEILEDMSLKGYKFDALKMQKEGCDSFFVPTDIFIPSGNDFFADILVRSK